MVRNLLAAIYEYKYAFSMEVERNGGIHLLLAVIL
jgi:hypothetical protein